MLPNEIDPFADHHIEKLLQILDTIHPEKVTERVVDPLNIEDIYVIVREARQALIRFKVCMADEVKQKRRYQDYAREHGYPYS